MTRLIRLVDDILAIVALISLFFLIVTPIGLAIEDSYGLDIYDDINDYAKDLLNSPLYSNPDYKPTLSPESHPEFHVEVKECLQNISDDCGVIIFNKIFDNGKYTDVDECCGQLLTLGKKCHHTIIESTIDSPEMKGVNKTAVWINSDNLWKKCSFVSH
uniref:Putative ovule protein n=1 Tax=Solanum chacoense TaxID=4108 RepID=A0A0V0GTV0_SOLCH